MDELLLASALTQAAAVRSGTVSSEELVRARLDRIVGLNATLNAVVQMDAEAALAAAQPADERVIPGPDSRPHTA